MRINNYTTKDYTELGRTYQLVLPLSLEGLVPNDDSVRLLSHELEDLDYTKLYQAYSAKGRNPAVDPKTMFKILTYAYSQNIYSSRKIETACKRDINFMWLLAGQKAPDHSTIARFRSGFWVLTIRVLPLIQDMKVKKGTAICGRRGSSHTLNPRPMKNGKSGVLNRISAKGKTWLTTRRPIPISVMPGRSCGCCI